MEFREQDDRHQRDRLCGDGNGERVGPALSLYLSVAYSL